MLTVHSIYKQQDREGLYQQFKPLSSCWVVSDLQSKKALRKILLQSHEAMLEDSILRAQELWKYLLKRVAPEFEVIPRANLELWLRGQLRSLRAEVDVEFFAEQHASGLLDMMSIFVPVFSQGGQFGQLQSFLQEQEWHTKNWNEHLIVAFQLWQKIIDKKWLIPDWVVHFLSGGQYILGAQEVFFTDLWVDLGADLRQAEADYFLALARAGTKVHIILPRFHRNPGEEVVFQPYEAFAPPPAHKDQLNSTNLNVRAIQAESPIAEAQSVVQQLRSLAERSEGVFHWERVAIAAPEIESYWKVLSWLLPAEGIPTQKPIVAQMVDFPWVQRFLDHLTEKTTAIGEEKMDFQGFCARALNPEKKVEPVWIEFLLRAQVSPFEKEKIPWSDWLIWVGEQLHKVEVEVQPEFKGGVFVVNLAEVEHLDVEHLFVLGLSADQLRPEMLETIPFAEMNAIHSHLGYFLRHLEQSRLVLTLRWVLASRSIPIVLSRSQTNLAGKMVPPHTVWLESQSVPVDERRPLVWDSRSTPLAVPPITAVFSGGESIVEVSASSVDVFTACPMKWGFEKRLHLRSQQDQEFQLEERDSGTMMHDLLATAVEQKWFLDRELTQHLPAVRGRVEEHLFARPEREQLTPLIWQITLDQISEQLFLFLQKEIAWRAEHPGTQTIAVEKEFILRIEDSIGVTAIRGKVDRVDLDSSGGLHIVDYKGKFKADFNFKKISEDFSYTQLSAYSIGIEQLWPENPLRSATIWSYKTGDRGYGFSIDHKNEMLRTCAAISREQWHDLREKTLQHYGHVALRMRQGEVSPSPRNSQVCVNCDWSRLCRAPHLFP